MRTPKLVQKGSVQFVTATVEQDLIFPANPLIELILRKCLARALELYDLIICHILFETTHFHMLVVIEDPEALKDFMRHFKAESAHAINRLLGRRKRTIWCEGYDNPTVLDLEKAIEMIAYLYGNPAKDGLVDRIEQYPGLSSWRSFQRGECTFEALQIARDDIRKLPNRALSYREYRNEARLLSRGRKKGSFTVSPDAWIEAFGVTDPQERQAVNQRIVLQVRELEALAREERLRSGLSVIGASRLLNTPIGREFLPQRTGRKSICLSSCSIARIAFIKFAKRLFAEGREIFRRWKLGDLHLLYPIGLYPPSHPRRAELLPG